jgi:hypothetical protein
LFSLIIEFFSRSAFELIAEGTKKNPPPLKVAALTNNKRVILTKKHYLASGIEPEETHFVKFLLPKSWLRERFKLGVKNNFHIIITYRKF